MMNNFLTEWKVTECTKNKYPVHRAARKGDVDALRELVARGYVVNCTNEDQGRTTPLHEASCHAHINAVKYLIEEGAWVDATNIDGATPLVEACSAGHFEIAEILIENGAQINPVIYGPSSSPLHEAAFRGYLNIMKLLIARGAKLNVPDRQYGTPLHAACHALKTDLKCIVVLLEAGADVNAVYSHTTPLHIACEKDCMKTVQLLLNYGASVFVRDRQGKRPSRTAKSSIRRLLLRYERQPRTLVDCSRLSILRDMMCRGEWDIRLCGLPKNLEQFILRCKSEGIPV